MALPAAKKFKVQEEANSDSHFPSDISSELSRLFKMDSDDPNQLSYPYVPYTTIRPRPRYLKLCYCDFLPGISWRYLGKYNDYMPCRTRKHKESYQSSISLEYTSMDYMAIGYESDEYYEADDESEDEKVTAPGKRKIERGRHSRYFMEAGESPESIVRFFIENSKSPSSNHHFIVRNLQKTLDHLVALPRNVKQMEMDQAQTSDASLTV